MPANDGLQLWGMQSKSFKLTIPCCTLFTFLNLLSHWQFTHLFCSFLPFETTSWRRGCLPASHAMQNGRSYKPRESLSCKMKPLVNFSEFFSTPPPPTPYQEIYFLPVLISNVLVYKIVVPWWIVVCQDLSCVLWNTEVYWVRKSSCFVESHIYCFKMQYFALDKKMQQILKTQDKYFSKTWNVRLKLQK